MQLWIIASKPRVVDGVELVILMAEESTSLRIEVNVEVVYPVALALREDHKASSASETLNFQLDVPWHWKFESWAVSTLSRGPLSRQVEFVDIDDFLNVEIPIPGLGGNRIMLRRRCSDHRRPCLMFPRLEMLGLEMLFLSTWYDQQIMSIIEIDILKPCPQKQIWPYCAWCGKFHLPYEGYGSHRKSKKHEKAQWYLDNRSAEHLREQAGFMHVRGRWL